ncbi:NAD(P)-binding protein [Aaosphaeria arxii CBS 175.79]|uniref:NAD(P)-binding protein n=1 Tax=Aaosphaeria arxii CBS 175.79 TaxID=1450172 RepID=A0A6A5XX74_9PLEO|nr:NAD(P)-binding protein [Aaosphaeria arxii CBS 175.79]KAF2017311.1 NAD(P)-binding protein [Aaosphaeria arxii CBS 175.79]
MSNNNQQFQLGQVFNVKDRVALVTGGGSGIGLMITQALAVNGAKVYITGRTQEKLDTVAENYSKDIQGQIIPIQGNVATKEGVKKLVQEIESREKCLCILVNNAGIATSKADTSGEKSAEEARKEFFDSTSVEEWTDTYATNVVGPYMMTTAFLPLLQKSTENHPGWSGTVINITSISGLVRISQGHFAYNSSKGAQVHLNKLLSAEIQQAGLKVRVNSIAPGVFPSEMTTQESDETQKSHMPKEKKEGLPSQRPGKDQDMAAAILFAASCQYLNGQTIAVDGGYLIQAGT